ncbi:MAG: RNA polymerase sigma factor [Lentisphaerae bacterium]|nr:MAG: RNA polymerase sigma factor [Lentisphaerota bacterium]
MAAETDKLDEQVLLALKRRDPEAPRLLLDVFGDRIYGLCLRILGNEEDARETAQETFVTIWRKWSSFQGRSKFSSWVYRIAANCAYMRLRKRRRRGREVSFSQFYDRANNPSAKQEMSQNSLPEDLIKGRILSPSEIIQNEELARLIDAAIDSLPPASRLAFVLKDIEGISLKEIAATMNISEAAVKSRIHRARMQLRKELRLLLEAENVVIKSPEHEGNQEKGE